MTLRPLHEPSKASYPARRPSRRRARRGWLAAATAAASAMAVCWAAPAVAETAAEPPPVEPATAPAEPPPPPPPQGDEQGVVIPPGEDDLRLGGVPPRPDPPCERPVSEWAAWIRLGGGALLRLDRDAAEGLFDFGIGFDGTVGLDEPGDVRLGAWAEARTRTFGSLSPRGGLELFFGALPGRLHLFQYDGEGVLSIRAGAGYSFVGVEGGLEREGVVVTGTLAYGYRAPWNLWHPYGECDRDESPCRAPARYMIPVRLYVAAEGGITGDRFWQITAGLEFEPIGSFRYILGLA